MSPRWGSDREAASDVIGGILLVGVTIGMMTGLSLLMASFDGPGDQVHADLAISASPGKDGWGTGDEQVLVRHRGGEAVPREGLSVHVRIGASSFRYEGAALDGTFADGELTFGETWTKQHAISLTDEVLVSIVTGQTTSDLLSTAAIRPGGTQAALGCLPDISPPTIQTRSQSPADLSATSSGALSITIALADACSGVDNTQAPELRYRLNDGTNPPWSGPGSLTLIAPGQWSIAIADPGWSSQVGRTFEYQFLNLTDLAGNRVDSIVHGDYIQLLGTYSLTTGFQTNRGTISEPQNAQSHTDGQAVALLDEAADAIAIPIYATTSNASGVDDAANIQGPPDNLRATGLDQTGDHVDAGAFDIAGQTGTVTKVELVFEGHYTGLRIDDNVRLSVDIGTGWVPATTFPPDPLADGTRITDITNLRASWDWSDLASPMQLRADYVTVSTQDTMDVRIDALYLQVTVAGTQQSIEVEAQFPILPAGATHLAELQYSTTGDTFLVEVWNGTAWNQRGAALNAVSLSVWSYLLTSEEAVADAGKPLLRIVDATPLGTTQGQILLDYAAIVTI